MGGFRFIESDFHYNDEENALTEAESSVLQTLNENKNKNTTPSATQENPRETSRESYKESSEGNTSVSNNYSKSQEDNTEEEQIMTVEQDLSLHDNQDNNDSGSRASTMQSVENPSSLTLESSISSIPSNPSVEGSFSRAERNTSTNLNHRAASHPVAFTSKDNLHKSNTNHSVTSTNSLLPIRSIDQRSLPPQNLNDIIREYSNVDQFGNTRPNTALMNNDSENDMASVTSQSTLQRIKSSNLTRMLTSDATVSKKDIEESGTFLPDWLRKFPLTSLLVFFAKNCLRPCSMAVILALIIAFIPWVKALFVTTPTTPNIKQAPDQQPALSFLMDFTSYVGAASVPFGLILLGATLGKLKIGKLYPGFWKSACILVFLRQCIMPIFGVLWCDRLVKAGWVNWEDDKMLLFVIAVSWNLPTMTTLIYFTASYTPTDCLEPIQMQCTAFFLMIQYPVMVVSLPFLVSYFLKVQMKL